MRRISLGYGWDEKDMVWWMIFLRWEGGGWDEKDMFGLKRRRLGWKGGGWDEKEEVGMKRRWLGWDEQGWDEQSWDKTRLGWEGQGWNKGQGWDEKDRVGMTRTRLGWEGYGWDEKEELEWEEGQSWMRRRRFGWKCFDDYERKYVDIRYININFTIGQYLAQEHKVMRPGVNLRFLHISGKYNFNQISSYIR